MKNNRRALWSIVLTILIVGGGSFYYKCKQEQATLAVPTTSIENENESTSKQAAQVVQIEPEAPESIRGTAKTDINAKRGTRGNASKAQEWTAETVIADYARVGIEITPQQANEIKLALNDYTVYENYGKMRAAVNASNEGAKLDAEAQRWFDEYQSVVEYIRIAPSYPSDLELYRGLSGENPYMDWLKTLKAGDDFDLGRLSSFSTTKETARKYATDDGIVLVITGGVIDGIAIDGFSSNFNEHEVLVSDRYFEVTSVVFDLPPDRARVLTVRKK